ncbi:MAG: hypothetical protein DHS80DRAFT_22908 [Piptocephalis tieghemiana]|nr:MAG: hypothetical protein DHS80DRAFT_22908 [Piptocephalis tieghemiana]
MSGASTYAADPLIGDDHHPGGLKNIQRKASQMLRLRFQKSTPTLNQTSDDISSTTAIISPTHSPANPMSPVAQLPSSTGKDIYVEDSNIPQQRRRKWSKVALSQMIKSISRKNHSSPSSSPSSSLSMNAEKDTTSIPKECLNKDEEVTIHPIPKHLPHSSESSSSTPVSSAVHAATTLYNNQSNGPNGSVVRARPGPENHVSITHSSTAHAPVIPEICDAPSCNSSGHRKSASCTKGSEKHTGTSHHEVAKVGKATVHSPEPVRRLRRVSGSMTLKDEAALQRARQGDPSLQLAMTGRNTIRGMKSLPSHLSSPATTTTSSSTTEITAKKGNVNSELDQEEVPNAFLADLEAYFREEKLRQDEVNCAPWDGTIQDSSLSSYFKFSSSSSSSSSSSQSTMPTHMDLSSPELRLILLGSAFMLICSRYFF